MKRKLISALLATTMVITLAACGKAKTTQTAASATTSAETTATTETPLRIGLVLLHDEASSYDLNFIEAMQAVQLETGVEVITKSNIPEANECFEACEDLVDRGCTLIFGDSFGFEDFMIQSAQLHPDVQYCHATGVRAASAGLPNFHNAFAHIEQGRYLAGVAAGLKMQELGETHTHYVGAFDYSEVNQGASAYYLGVKSIVPDATMDILFTGSWYSESGEREAAAKLLSLGGQVISGHADSNGVSLATKETGGFYIGYNGSFKAFAPDNYITSCKINWAPYFTYIIDCVKTNTEIATDWCGDFNTGSVEMCELNETVAAAGTKGKLAEVEEGLKNGSIKVFDTSTFTVNGETLTSHIINGNETIINGEFVEGKYQSAPMIDFRIDGITYLTTE